MKSKCLSVVILALLLVLLCAAPFGAQADGWEEDKALVLSHVAEDYPDWQVSFTTIYSRPGPDWEWTAFLDNDLMTFDFLQLEALIDQYNEIMPERPSLAGRRGMRSGKNTLSHTEAWACAALAHLHQEVSPPGPLTRKPLEREKEVGSR